MWFQLQEQQRWTGFVIILTADVLIAQPRSLDSALTISCSRRGVGAVHTQLLQKLRCKVVKEIGSPHVF